MKAVVITGVSTGIGATAARFLSREGFHVFGTVRADADAEPLRADLGAGFTTIVMDVTDAAAADRAAALVAAKLGRERLGGLVNNAGIAVQGPLLHQPLHEVQRHLDVNLLAPVMLVQKFAPLLGSDPSRTGPLGRIVNISSVAGGVAGPFVGAYCISKHALEAFSDSLRRELLLFGVDVIIIGPGTVKTAIWDKAQSHDTRQYAATPFAGALKRFEDDLIGKGRNGAEPDDIAAAIVTALTAPRPKARYAIVKGKFEDWTLPRALPRRALDRLVAMKFGLRRPQSLNV